MCGHMCGHYSFVAVSTYGPLIWRIVQLDWFTIHIARQRWPLYQKESSQFVSSSSSSEEDFCLWSIPKTASKS